MRSKHNTDLTPYARTLRKNMTPQERRLWYECLRDYPVRFYRQKVLGAYIADFYCAAASLVVELDGSQHYETDGPEKDRARTAFLSGYGLTILRFSNYDIQENFYGVCTEIDRFVRSKLGAQFPQQADG